MNIRVNPIECVGHGLCAELLPERIHLDEWGYPIVAPGEVPPDLEALARRAADACPTLALLLGGGGGAEGGTGRSPRGRRPMRVRDSSL